MLVFKTLKHHWNYFLAIESDLENLSRYIEFSEDNLNVYSIELARILISASSEVDVIMKQLCNLINPLKKVNNINDYKNIVRTELNSFIHEEIAIDRFEITYRPWDNWNGLQNPDWWKSYNNVKHQRNNYFKEANLQNTLNAVGALLLVVIYYYKFAFSKEGGHEVSFLETTRQLKPDAKLLRINADYYYSYLIG